MSESDHVLNGEDEKLKKGAFVSFRFVFVFVCRSVGRSVKYFLQFSLVLVTRIL